MSELQGALPRHDINALIDDQTEERFVYLKSAFTYRYIDEAKTVYSDVNLCFQDMVGVPQNYFLAGHQYFPAVWKNFINSIKKYGISKKMFEFSIIPVSTLNKKQMNKKVSEGFPYNMMYDIDLFDSYDGHPIKIIEQPIKNQCEITMGKYFMSR